MQGKNKEVVKEVIKEVLVKVPMQASLSKEDIDGLYAENAQLKAALQEKEIIYLEKGAQILREINDYKKQIADFNENIANLQDMLNVKTS